MALKSNKIKNMNDFISGLLFCAGGLWLMFSKNITEGRILASQNQGIIKADTYIRMLGGLVVLLAVIMIIRSINFKRAAEIKAFEFHITKESFLTLIALIAFIILLKPLGFALTTFSFTFFIVIVYMLREMKEKEISRREKIKKFVIAGIFSFVLVLVVYLVFSRVLLVMLP